MGVIFALSAQPSLPHAPDELLDLALKKVAHFGEYAILGALLWRAISGRLSGFPARLLVGVALGSLYAATDEIHQSFVPGRQPAFSDLLIDSVGTAAGLAVLYRFDSSRLTQAAPRLAPGGFGGPQPPSATR